MQSCNRNHSALLFPVKTLGTPQGRSRRAVTLGALAATVKATGVLKSSQPIGDAPSCAPRSVVEGSAFNVESDHPER
jgi:hypothetical protein